MPLTEIAIKAAKPAEKITRLYDEKGLYLEISPAGGRWWRFKYSIGGKEKRLSLGVYPEVSLKDARAKRDEYRQIVAAGNDPGDKKKEAKRKDAGAQSFEQIARLWWGHWRIGKNERYANYAITRLETDVFPELGATPINSVTTRNIIDCVRKIEKRGVSDLAYKQLDKISQVFRYAIANELAERNPAKDVSPSDVLKPVKATNLARIPSSELPAMLKKIDEYDGKPVTVFALKLMAMTFVRTSELIGGRWKEIDGAFWRIPKERMKMKSPHIVPLSTQAVVLLADLRKITGEGELMFPGERAGAMSNNTILYALYRMGYRSRMTGHGFRGLASTILHEQGFPHEHIELQLAHSARDEVSAAYNHALYLEPRAKMMQAWSDYLDARRAEIAG
ncbi:MAG: integrase arm-type DNA-binding domain-containing protein [Azonexus sp.]